MLDVDSAGAKEHLPTLFEVIYIHVEHPISMPWASEGKFKKL